METMILTNEQLNSLEAAFKNKSQESDLDEGHYEFESWDYLENLPCSVVIDYTHETTAEGGDDINEPRWYESAVFIHEIKVYVGEMAEEAQLTDEQYKLIEKW